jgi:membrane protein
MAAAAAPATPSDLPAGSWWAALKRTVRAVPENNVMDTGRRP